MSLRRKPPVLFVHGAWHGAWCWEKYFTQLFKARGYDTHVFNLPKHDQPGKIKGINGVRIRHYVDALKAEVDKLNQPPIIIGHSMGGYILQKYLETEGCKKAVLMAPVPITGVARTTGNLTLKHKYARKALRTLNLYLIVDTPAKAKWAFFSDSIPTAELNEFSSKLCSESYRAFVSMLGPNIILNPHVQVPMLVIGAEDDRIFTRLENSMTASFFSADFEMVPDCAHDMMLDVNHRVVADKILDWLDK